MVDGVRVALRSGEEVLVRPVRPDDARTLADGFGRLSELSRFRRFFTAVPELSDSQLDYLTRVDHHDHEAIGAVEPETGAGLGIARFIRSRSCPEEAEVAVTVVDAWQRRGLGSLLLRQIAERAITEGVTLFTAEVQATNDPVLKIIRKLGPAEFSRDGGTVSVRVDLTRDRGGGAHVA